MATSEVKNDVKIHIRLSVEEALFIKIAVQNSRADGNDYLRESIFGGLPDIQDLNYMLMEQLEQLQ